MDRAAAADPRGRAAAAPAPGSGRRPRLVVVRHGATRWSKDGRHTGRTDLPLLEEGAVQAGSLRRALAGVAVGAVYTSPLRRARQTCELAGFGDRAVVCDDLREWDYGDYEGLTTDDIRAARPGWSLWRDGAPGGEDAQDVGRRCDRVVAAVRAAGQDALAFAHAHVLRVLAARWIGLSPADGACFVLEAAALGVLGWERETPVVQRWNDTAAASPAAGSG